ncbi:MAG: crossover junction endodeoxyribonuclease RuvC [Bacillota bacterium]|nr:crossover junction endodeoxyribonuclease RuvC [Bacillota bacterium]
MLVLGIDPGTAIMGYGFVESHGNRLKAVAYGALRTTAGTPNELRLRHIYEELTGLIETYRPDIVSVEELFFNKNVRTAMAVGQARGVALLAAANANVSLLEFTPLQVKQSVVGYGKATKEQVIFMIQKLLNLHTKLGPDDVADALAVAICATHAHNLAGKLRTMEGHNG